MAIAEALAAYCSSLSYEDLPPSTRDRAKQVLLDTLGIAVGSARAETTPVVLDALADIDPDGGNATVLTSSRRRSPSYAALANGTLAHSLDYDETHRAGSVHGAAPVLGGAIPMAEAIDADGEALLTALVAGYEVTARLGMALNSEAHYAKGFHATSTCGVYGAAAAIGHLRGFDADDFATSFGIGGSQAAGSLQFLENGAWNKRVHPGLAAHSAWIATALAEEDFVAASDPIDGPRGFLQAYSDDPVPERATAGLGEGFEIDRTGFKPYPLCRFVHPAVDGLLDLVTTHDLSPADVTAIRVGMASAGYNIVGDPAHVIPESIVDAQFSMPFAMMIVVTRREAGVDALFDAVQGGFSEEERRLLRATTTRPVAWADEGYPDTWGVEVAVETAETTYETTVDDARGDPQSPLSWDELRTKYDELVAPVVGQSVADQFRERIESVEDHTVAELLAPIREAEFREPVSAPP